jgi:TPR repeat protein
MRRVLLGLVTGLALVPANSVAEDVQSTRACDLTSTSPFDRLRPTGISGVAFDKIDAKIAIPACQAALAAAPANPRLLFQMGRAFDAIKDYDKARGFYEKAAGLGYATAQTALGVFYQNGRGGLPKNDQEAARLYKLAADQGDAFGQLNLGVFYENGRGGLPKNDQEAARLLKLAADQGNVYAQSYLKLAAAQRNSEAKTKLAEVRGEQATDDRNSMPSDDEIISAIIALL